EEQLEARGGGGSSDPTAGAELLAPSLLGRLAAHDQELADLAALVASRPSRACQPDDDAIALAAVSTQLHQHIGALREEVAALALLAVAHRPAPVPADLMARVEAIEAAVFP